MDPQNSRNFNTENYWYLIYNPYYNCPNIIIYNKPFSGRGSNPRLYVTFSCQVSLASSNLECFLTLSFTFITLTFSRVMHHSRLHSRGSTRVPPTSRGAPFPPPSSRGGILSLRGQERIPAFPSHLKRTPGETPEVPQDPCQHWRAPHLEMRRNRREFFPDDAGKGSLFSSWESEKGPCLPPEDLLDPGIKHVSPTSPALAGGFFATGGTWEALGP